MKTVTINNVPVKMWVDTIDAKAWQQISNLASLPFVYSHIAIMPDAHGGVGMPIGGVLATKNVIVPNAVGVDIGCGMCAVKTDVKVADIPDDVLRKQILRGIRKRIPLGMARHKQPQDESLMPQGIDIEQTTVVKREYQSALKQIGTLGGNHFIELQRDDDGNLRIMIHSGSRNLGKMVCDYYSEKAAVLNRQWFSAVASELNLAFIPKSSPVFKAYWTEMSYCMAFARNNRMLMMDRICEVIADAIPGARFAPAIDIMHNYAATEEHFGEQVIVHRKGATRAEAGEVGIIPGSQGTSSYIVEGLGNEESFRSSSHGAGRCMSRTQAVNDLSLADEIAALDAKNIIHAIRFKTDLAEASSAYKNIDEVMRNQSDLVRTVTRLSPVAVIKGD